jgi:predicted flap endonuclease-1-like 5' DNA nuclease
LKNRIRNQEKELTGIKTDAQKFKSELGLALSEKAKLTATLNESQVNEMKNKIQRLENDLHSSRMLVAKFQSEANAVADEKKKLQAESVQVEQFKKDSDSLRSKLSTVESDLQKARQGLAEVNQLKTDIQNLKSEKDKWENEANAQAQNAADAIQSKEKIIVLEKQIQAIQQEKERAEKSSAEVLHLKEDQGQLRTKIALLESDLVASRQAYEELEKNYEALQSGNISSAELNEASSASLQTSGTSKPDNLSRIEGIGPKLEDLFYENNIYTFQQLAGLSVERIQSILDEAGEQYRIHDPETWPEQAKLLAEGKFEEFEKLSLELKAGKRE